MACALDVFAFGASVVFSLQPYRFFSAGCFNIWEAVGLCFICFLVNGFGIDYAHVLEVLVISFGVMFIYFGEGCPRRQTGEKLDA